MPDDLVVRIAVGAALVLVALHGQWQAYRARTETRALHNSLADRIADAILTIGEEAPEDQESQAVDVQGYRSTTESPNVKKVDVDQLPENWHLLRDITAADINGDGQDELLVQYTTGAHGNALKVFGWGDDRQFAELTALGTSSGALYQVTDFDSDGRLELKGWYVDWNAGKPYATAPWYAVYYRWEEDGWKVVAGPSKKINKHQSDLADDFRYLEEWRDPSED